MNLLKQATETFKLIRTTSSPDGYGGETVTTTLGTSFDAALARDSSNQNVIAASAHTDDVYHLLTPRTIQLEPYTKLLRVKNNQIFEVVDSALDYQTPDSSALDLRAYEIRRLEEVYHEQ